MGGPRRAREANAERAENYRLAWEMRLSNRTEAQIAAHFGVTQPTISRWLREAWQQRLAPIAMQLRVMETDKLDVLEAKVDALIDSVYVTVSGGKIIYNDVDGKPIEDTGPIIRAMETKLRIMNLRADLHGYKAPTRVQADVIVPGLDPAIKSKIESARAANDQVVEGVQE
jgi:hypothetical protein